jgi:hypothetical protein
MSGGSGVIYSGPDVGPWTRIAIDELKISRPWRETDITLR